ncbi:helix-turn-helix domain-containing protein [Jannaschia formosa]|uniref:helix-turn-helix domain-containing protein n=1 Tax=Jannaschia formosa TaxID=2259592 RepID=UPI000E1B7625|nr:cupin domain-containing protein [Jannaschia formosa]TFL16318.1 cupin domain-containing protein [Jannaschia formosa]
MPQALTAERAPPEAPDLGPAMRRRRKALGLTLRATAETAGLSTGYMSQVETGKAVPTLGTLAQIAAALGVSLDYFVAETRPVDALSRADGRRRFSVPGSPVEYEAVSADYPGSSLVSYVLHVPPGYRSETTAHEGEEVIFILEGTIDQTLAGQTMRMGPGDSLHYDGAIPHAWANAGPDPARVLWTGTLTVLHQGGAAAGTEKTTEDPTGER